MKCLILAGGRGERLWPLSRKNYPKQFIQIQKNHSVFQETVARNIPYCDEFIIVTSYEYRFIIDDQMKAFQGTPYRCVYEDEPKKTTAAITLACLDLQPSEFVFVVAADHLIDVNIEMPDAGKGYKDTILRAKEYAREGAIVLFGMKEADIDSRFGYLSGLSKDGSIEEFVEKPDKMVRKRLSVSGVTYRNLGMILFQNAVFLHELERQQPEIWRQCCGVFKKRKRKSALAYYPADLQQELTPISIEKSLFEKSSLIKMVPIGFKWNDLGSLEDLSATEYQTDGVSIINDCAYTTVINNSTRQAVVVNDLDNILVVNTADAVYVGRHGKSGEMKGILRDHPELTPYADNSTKYYRPWGSYELLFEESEYRIRQAFLLPGKTIYSHKHTRRSENWTIVKGKALITLDGQSQVYEVKDNIDIPAGVEHQISNIGEETVVFVETAVGEILQNGDIVADKVADLDESQLGYSVEPMVKLLPAYKDYIWGGTKLRDVYGVDCDYDIIAESWQLSAHPAGQSIIASGRHKGKRFGDYISIVGREVLGWKCSPLKEFPLLIKFIDATGNLSVQVHPDDDYALENENEYGKNEMWYVIDAEPGAGLYVGFKRDVCREEVERRVKDNTIMEILNFYPTKPGDVFFIPAGTVHAIGAGNLICEIQQSSNCTYRLYDYDRKDKYGKPRELHLQKALDVLNYKEYVPVDFEVDTNDSGTVLSRCKYFESIIYEVRREQKITLDNDRFYSVVCIKGKGSLQIDDGHMEISAGESVFIPATDKTLIVDGELSVVVSHI